MTDTPDEKRRTPRIQPFVAPCQVAAGERRLSGYLTDLSLEGARVACDALPPLPEEWVTVEVRLPGQAERSRLRGRVKWALPVENSRGHAFGITFDEMSAGGQAAVAAVVAEFRRRAAEMS